MRRTKQRLRSQGVDFAQQWARRGLPVIQASAAEHPPRPVIHRVWRHDALQTTAQADATSRFTQHGKRCCRLGNFPFPGLDLCFVLSFGQEQYAAALSAPIGVAPHIKMAAPLTSARIGIHTSSSRWRPMTRACSSTAPLHPASVWPSSRGLRHRSRR